MKHLPLYGILILLFALLATTAWFVSRPSFQDPWPVDETLTSYYRETYEENRNAFRESCNRLKRIVPGTTSRALPVQSRSASDLTIDLCDVPGGAGPAGSKLLIITSGLHGGEGYASSAVQRMVMDEVLPQASDRPAALFIHSVNPYGMKMFRRVTENNVDLNRNFDAENSLYSLKNPGYAEVYDLLNPIGPADPWTQGNRFFALRAIVAIARKGMDPLRQAVLQGQYEWPEGLYYGGNAPEQQRAILDPIFRGAARGKTLVAIIDLHTGYGERGTAHLFPNTAPNQQIHTLTEQLFDGYHIDWPGQGFYSVHGEFSEYVGTLFDPGVRYVPMLIEYGTLDSQTTRGSIRSIHTTLLENQATQYGCTSEEACNKIRQDFREMYFPSSPSWRSKILRDSHELFRRTLIRMHTI